MRWVDALKQYAATKGKYVVPKKGTPEYEEVRAIMGGAPAAKKVEMPVKEYKAEHKHLAKVLKTGSLEERKKEAAKQLLEMLGKTGGR